MDDAAIHKLWARSSLAEKFPWVREFLSAAAPDDTARFYDTSASDRSGSLAPHYQGQACGRPMSAKRELSSLSEGYWRAIVALSCTYIATQTVCAYGITAGNR